MTHGNSSTVTEYFYLDAYWLYMIYNMPFSIATFELLEVVIQVGVNSVISTFGIVANCINIVIFYRQGPLSHSCTVSLLGVAVADLGYCFLSVSRAALVVLSRYKGVDWVWEPEDISVYALDRQNYVVSQIGGVITAFMSVERLFSVMFPFRVKAVFTPKRSCVVIICIFIVISLLWATNTYAKLPEWVWDSERQVSVLEFNQIDYTDTILEINSFCTYFGRFVLLPLGVVLVLVCNFIIYWKVNISKQFREVSATTTHNVSPSCQDPKSSSQDRSKEATSQKTKTDATYNAKKEIKLFRMLTVVCFVYGITYMAVFISLLVLDGVGLKLGVHYHMLTENLVLHLVNVLQAISASCNIIIYYTMNSRYRKDLQQLCFCYRRK